MKGHGKHENPRAADQQGRDTLSPHSDTSRNGRLCISVVVPRRGHWFTARKAQFPDLTFWALLRIPCRNEDACRCVCPEILLWQPATVVCGVRAHRWYWYCTNNLMARPALGPTQPYVQWVPGLCRVKRPGRGVDDPPYLPSRLQKGQSYTCTPPLGLRGLF